MRTSGAESRRLGKLPESAPAVGKSLDVSSLNEDDDDDDGSRVALGRSMATQQSNQFSILGADETTNRESPDSDTRQNPARNSARGIAATETKQIKKLRCMVILVFIFAIACAILVYFYVKRTEQGRFESQFHEDAIKILSTMGQTLDFMMGGINALTVSIVSHAESSGQTWPFVTVPDFAIRAGKFLSLSRAIYINTYMYVQTEQRAEWENYTAHHNYWVEESLDIQEQSARYSGPLVRNYTNWDVIHGYDELNDPSGASAEFGTNRTGPYMPMWQVVPVIPYDPPYNWDLMSINDTNLLAVNATHKTLLSAAYMIAYANDTEEIKLIEDEVEWVKDYIPPDEDPMEPISDIYYPIIAEATDAFDAWDGGTPYDPANYTLGGLLATTFYWRDMIRDILPPGSRGIVIVFSNPCNPTFSYSFDGPDVEYLGTVDAHEARYGHLRISTPLLDSTQLTNEDSSYSGAPINDEVCGFHLDLYPSATMESDYSSWHPIVYSVTAGIIFLVFALIFLLYDLWVERRQRKVMTRARRTSLIVEDMFPDAVAGRLMDEIEAEEEEEDQQEKSSFLHKLAPASMLPSNRLVKTYLDNGDKAVEKVSKPIAEIYPYATVMYADIPGFGAWTTSRDPSQVFVLLETIFKEFDVLARRRRVYKVETVGDRYVAVTGLPDRQDKHAMIMARFAWECLTTFAHLSKELEVKLGPDTSSLGVRIGLHSGPVTAGVLRVDRSRFQIFGDTAYIASEMERTGAKNRIHVSHTTANFLIASGKSHWLTRLTEPVVGIGGSGVVATYWLVPKTAGDAASVLSQSQHLYEGTEGTIGNGTAAANKEAKRARLVDWVVKLLLEHIRDVVARHQASGVDYEPKEQVSFTRSAEMTCLDEVQDVIKMPKFDGEVFKAISGDARKVEISSIVVEQLERLVSILSATYRDNPFHCWEHACHVTMNVDKFLKRISNADVEFDHTKSRRNLASVLHNFTHGITSDPLTILAIVFSALIHDSDHRGVSNAQLCKEDEQMANLYRNQSVAEQNSVDIAWTILMGDDFRDLRGCIFPNNEELLRFRQVVVNVVLATDIFDKELNDLRKKRWHRAFSERNPLAEDFVDTQATIVIEHIIQASDVSHTMQHWDIYRKWNELLFAEMTAAFRAGRMEKDPATFWYQGEIGFFDNYIIPLARKLKECNVFGVSSDECLNYAQKNRTQWEHDGEAIVASLVDKYKLTEEETISFGEAADVSEQLEDIQEEEDDDVKAVTIIMPSAASTAAPTMQVDV